MFSSTKTWLAAVLAVFAAGAAEAVVIDIASTEFELSDPDDKAGMTAVMWVGWTTQLYEYNMPFIEIANPDTANLTISEVTMTIGDTDFNFANEFLNKEWTNSYPYPADGVSPTATGATEQGADFVSSVADGGDLLVIEFPSGLAPGELVRFQIDINRDADATDRKTFADYPQVMLGAGSNPGVENSFITVSYVGVDSTVSGHLQNPPDSIDVQTPRPHFEMQPMFNNPPTTFEEIPEPATGLLVGAALAAVAGRRRR